MIYEKFALPERCVGQTLHVATTLKQFAHTVAQKTGPLLHQAVGIYILSKEQIKYKFLKLKNHIGKIPMWLIFHIYSTIDTSHFL